MKLFKSIGIFCLLVVVSLWMAGCGDGGGGSSDSSGGTTHTPATYNVSIVSGATSVCTAAYSQDSITIAVGDTVKWTNNDGSTHTVTSTNDNGTTCTAGGGTTTGSPLNSSDIAANGTFSYTFTAAGTYYYVCTKPGHQMRGTVIVQ